MAVKIFSLKCVYDFHNMTNSEPPVIVLCQSISSPPVRGPSFVVWLSCVHSLVVTVLCAQNIQLGSKLKLFNKYPHFKIPTGTAMIKNVDIVCSSGGKTVLIVDSS